jgi:hypothetical protein
MTLNRSLVIAAAALLLPLASATANESKRTSLGFEVLLDDKPIGTHEFRIFDDAGLRTVETNARFDVNVLFVPVFSYNHSNTEVWRDGCLAQVRSETDSNGTPYRVMLERAEGAYEVQTIDESLTYPADCLMTFAYWDPAILEQPRLLNSQTGELVDVRVEPLGVTDPDWLSSDVPVEGHRIVGEDADVDIRVFYHRETGRWVALESLLSNGRIMRYVPSQGLQSSLDGRPLSLPSGG